MFGALGNITGLMKAAKDIQGQIGRIQQELAAARFEADAGAGMVQAVVDGRCNLVQIKIDPAAMGDVELLEDLIKAAVGAATAKAHEGLKSRMASLTGGLNIPGLTQMLG